jgi:TrmH family RNA methyltransferase
LSELTITSVRNPRVQAAVGLRDRRERDRQGRILIDGLREIGRAADAGIKLVEAYICRELLASDAAQVLVRRLEASDIPLVPVTPRVFEKMAYGQRADGVLGVAQTPSATLDNLRLPDRALLVVLEACEKPGNLGAVLRSADGAGVSAVIVADGRTDLFNPNAIRASLGTIFSVPLAAATTPDVQSWLRERGIAVIAARVDAKMDYTEADFTGPTAIVLGSEAAGLSEAWSTGHVTSVRVPMRGIGDSLNVAATAAVLFYEALRQRR